MLNHHFISHGNDGRDFAFRLSKALRDGQPSVPVWLDVEEIKLGDDWADRVEEAIKTCASLVLVMTPDSLHQLSQCKQEWSYALSCKRPVIPIKVSADLRSPFRLHNRHYADFTNSFEFGVEQLRKYIAWMGSPQGRLRELQYLLDDAQRDLQRTTDVNARRRISDDIAAIEEQIRQQELQIASPEQVARELEERIRRNLDIERRFRDLVPGESRVRVINAPPSAAPGYFQDRNVETEIIGDFLRDDSLRIITIVGRAGTGKTVLACRILKSVEQLHLPDDGGAINLDGILYEVCGDSPGTLVQNLYNDLSKLLPDELRKELAEYNARSNAAIAEKFGFLLKCFPRGRVVVLLDKFERAVNVETQRIENADLAAALTVILTEVQHAVKVIITTRINPADLQEPGRSTILGLDDGLAVPDAEKLLRQMDAAGTLGLQDAPREMLAEAHKRTLGLPRALEALFMVLASDRSASLSDVLEQTGRFLPYQVMDKLVGEAFSRLDIIAKHAMQILAVFGCPVPAVAVDYVMRHYRSSDAAEPTLRRLVNMRFTRCEGGRYYLHEADRQYALSRVPNGGDEFCRRTLEALAAKYYGELRKDERNCTSIDDLEPHLKQFDHLVAAEDFDNACRLLNRIDREHVSFWGHPSLIIEKRHKLLGKIGTRYLDGLNLGHLGSAYRESGDLTRAIEYYEKALDIARELSCKQATRWIGNMGLTWGNLGHVWKEKKCLDQALDLSRRISDRLHEGRWLCNLGGVYLRTDVEAANRYCQQALAITREMHDDRFEETCLTCLGIVADELGRTQKAAEYYRMALPITRRKGDKRGERHCLEALGDCHGRMGEKRVEVEYYQRALEVDRSITIGRGKSDETARALLIVRLVGVLMEVGDDRSALPICRDALQSIRHYGTPEDTRSVGVRLAQIAASMGDVNEAKNVLGEMTGIAQERSERAEQAGLQVCLAAMQSDAGWDKEANNSFASAIELARTLDGKLDRGRWPEVLNTADHITSISRAAGYARQRFEAGWFLLLGRAFAGAGELMSAKDCFIKALSCARQSGDLRREMCSLTALGDCSGQLRDKLGQSAFYEQALVIAKESGDLSHEANISVLLAAACAHQGAPRRSIGFLQRAAEISRQIEERERELRLRSQIGDLLMDVGDATAAIGHYKRALDIAQKMDKQEEQIQLLTALGSAHSFREERQKAIEYFEQTREIARQMPETDYELIALFDIADAYHTAGEVERAIQYYCEVLQKNKPPVNFKAAAGLGVAYLQQDCPEKAQTYFEQCAALCETRWERDPSFHTTWALALLGLGRTTEALEAYREGLEECLERQVFEGRIATGRIRWALLDLHVLERVPRPVPGLDEAIRLLKNALGRWEASTEAEEVDRQSANKPGDQAQALAKAAQ